MHVETVLIPDGDLERHVYRYMLDDRTMLLRLREYHHEVRETTRHKWQPKAQWGVNIGRDHRARRIELSDVRTSVDADREALVAVLKRIAIGPAAGLR